MEDRYLNEGRQMLAKLGISPCYVVTNTDHFTKLSAAEHRFMYAKGNEGIVAFTAPVADLFFKTYLRSQWKGRGFCVAFRQSPVTMTRDRVMGLLIHEAAHYVDNFDNPARSEPNVATAFKTFWNSLRTDEEKHGPRWLRAAVHLWHRACVAGYAVPLSECWILEQYGYGREDLKPLLAEATARAAEPIESIIAKPMAVARPKAKRAKRSQRPRVGQSRTAMIAGHLVTCHADGSVVTAPSLDGSVASRSYSSLRAFQDSLITA